MLPRPERSEIVGRKGPPYRLNKETVEVWLTVRSFTRDLRSSMRTTSQRRRLHRLVHTRISSMENMRAFKTSCLSRKTQHRCLNAVHKSTHQRPSYIRLTTSIQRATGLFHLAATRCMSASKELRTCLASRQPAAKLDTSNIKICSMLKIWILRTTEWKVRHTQCPSIQQAKCKASILASLHNT